MHQTHSAMSEEDEAGSHKRMRKGTHSCTECRERKVKCVFSRGTADCDECRRRGKSCLDQGTWKATTNIQDPNKSTRQWLGEIDDKAVQILQKLDGLSQIPALASLRPAAHEDLLERLHLELIRSATPSASTSRDEKRAICDQVPGSNGVESPQPDGHRIPLLSLIDNTVLQAENARTADSTAELCSASFPIVTDEAVRLLRLLIPSNSDLAAIIRATRCWWDLWEDLLPDDVPNEITRGELTDKILQLVRNAVQEGDLVALTKILLSLAICIQQLPRDFDFRTTRLLPSPHILQGQYLSTAEAVLSAKQGFCNTIDGLECMLIQIKFYVNMGKPRTAWLICQRGMSVCQVYGVNGLLNHSKDPIQRRWQIAFQVYWARDQHLSLLLGLPCYNCGDQRSVIDIRTIPHEGDRMQAIWTNLSILAGQIADRNLHASNMNLKMTLDIDEKIRERMPVDWWLPEPDAQSSIIESKNYHHSKFVFHNTRKLLHLPYMLKAMTDPTFAYSRDITLDASRKMIEIYGILRDDKSPLITICNAEDFYAFTAALVLVIQLLGPSTSHSQRQDSEDYGDWQLIERVSTVFRNVAMERGCSVAVQAHRFLEDVLTARHKFPAAKDGCYHAIIPFFGQISLMRRNAAPIDHETSSKDPQELSATRPSEFTNVHAPSLTLAEVPHPTFANPLSWSAVGEDWPLMGDDFDIDWNSFGQ